MKMVVAALLLGAFLGLCAVVGGRDWPSIAISYALLWPSLFAFAILPGVLIGRCTRTWQSSVVVTEIITTVGAAMMVHPPLEEVFRLSFGMLLAMANLAAFPPLLLSIFVGHYSRSWHWSG